MRSRQPDGAPAIRAAENRFGRNLPEVDHGQRNLTKIPNQNCIQVLGQDTKNHIKMQRVSPWSISRNGLLEAASRIFLWTGKISLVLMLSLMSSFLFWHIRSMIPDYITQSYKAYVIWLDTSLFGLLPSIWIQQHCRTELLDMFMRGVWFSYIYVLIFGSSLILIFRGQVQRHVLSVVFVLSFGLFIHYLVPTQPPWMAVNGVIRVAGDHISSLDMNLVAAMPSIHQAIICLAGCALWQFGSLGRFVGLAHNVLMTVSLVYLGEHFIVDSVAGIAIGIVSWILAGKVLLRYKITNNEKNHFVRAEK